MPTTTQESGLKLDQRSSLGLPGIGQRITVSGAWPHHAMENRGDRVDPEHRRAIAQAC